MTDDPPGPSGRGALDLTRDGLAFAIYLCLAILHTGIHSDFGTRFTAGPDSTQDVWVLAWVSGHLVSDPRHVFEGNTSFPSHHSVLFCDPLLGPALFALPMRLVTRNPVALYNATLLATLTVAGWGFFRVAWRVSGCASGSLLAGMLIVYSPQQTQHLPHLNLIAICGYPFLFLALLRLYDRPGLRPALASAFWLAFQAGTSGYHAFGAAFLCLIVAAVRWRELRVATAAYLGLAAVAAVALLLPYVAAFVELRSEEGITRGAAAAEHYSLSLGRDLVRTRARLWAPLLGGAGDAAFPGVVLLGLAAQGITRGPRRFRLLLGVLTALFFLLALGPGVQFQGRRLLPLPTTLLYEHLPLFDAIRHPVTFLVPATIGLGLLAALGASALRLGQRPVTLIALVVVAVLETLTRPPRRIERPLPVPQVYDYLAREPPGGILDLPVEDFEPYTWWSTFHRLPIVSGLGAVEPRAHAALYRLLKKEWQEGPPGVLEGRYSTGWLKTHYPIRYVVLHRSAGPVLRTSIEASPETLEWLHESPEGDRVYRFRRSGRGTTLRRQFRDDQLDSAQLRAELSGPSAGTAAASLNGRALGPVVLTGERQQAVWNPPPDAVVRGMNVFTLQMTSPGELTLYDVDTSVVDPTANAAPTGFRAAR